MQRGRLTDIAGSVPKEVDGHLVGILFPQHLLQHATAASPPSQGHGNAESGPVMHDNPGLCQHDQTAISICCRSELLASGLTFLYFIWKAAPRPMGIPSPIKANPPSCTKAQLSVAAHVL